MLGQVIHQEGGLHEDLGPLVMENPDVLIYIYPDMFDGEIPIKTY
jgi:hypothetical protein